MNSIQAVIWRDLLLSLRRRAELVNILAFFAVVTALFPIAVGPEPEQLRAIAPGVIWVAALLSSLLALPRLFAGDHGDGSLEQLILSPAPLSLLVCGKVLAHWLASGLPLVILGPLLCVPFDLPAASVMTLALTLLLGGPVLSLIGAVGAALTMGLRGSSMLLALIVLPLYVPVLIFGTGAVMRVETGLSPAADLLFLGACLAAAMPLAPWACAAALRISAE